MQKQNRPLQYCKTYIKCLKTNQTGNVKDFSEKHFQSLDRNKRQTRTVYEEYIIFLDILAR